MSECPKCGSHRSSACESRQNCPMDCILDAERKVRSRMDQMLVSLERVSIWKGGVDDVWWVSPGVAEEVVGCTECYFGQTPTEALASMYNAKNVAPPQNPPTAPLASVSDEGDSK